MITKFYESINEHLNSIKSSEQAVHAHTINEPHLSAISGTHHAGQRDVRMHASRTRARQATEYQDLCEWVVCVSEFENWQCEVPEAFKCR